MNTFIKTTTTVLAIILLFAILPVSCESYAWNCPDCGRTGNTGNYCGGCAHPAPWIEEAASSISALKAVKVGDYVTFGHYPQTAEGNDNTPIEWLVLDMQDNKALMISRYGLDCQPYNNSRESITWEECSLRIWLNDTFLNKSFSIREQSAILMTDVDNSIDQGYSGWKSSGGSNTRDKIFLLSCAGANRYFDVNYGSTNTKSRVQPTEYAIQQGAFTSNSNKTADGRLTGWWWLRSPGTYQNYAAYVYDDGSLDYYLVDDDIVCVRPVLWVDLTSDIF